ncbi:MAG: hypothetical protein BMS9Abin04_277 [Planctomycetia bacterium]|nr:MAG: hypothetical protein BMS9Abin04_277 [Planctomycetia bacterium]
MDDPQTNPRERSHARRAAGRRGAWPPAALGLVLAALCSAPGRAFEKDTAATAARAKELVRKLDADELAIRAAAERQLVDGGPELLPYLPQPSAAASAEVQHRLARIRAQLEQARAAAAARTSTVTFEGRALPAADVLATIEQQTGNSIVLDDSSAPAAHDSKVTVAWQAVPFWRALDELLDSARLTTYPYSGKSALRIVAADPAARPRSGHAAYSGPFRFEVVRVDAYRELRTSARRGVRVQIEVAWEPRLAPIGLTQPLCDVRAATADGTPLPPANRSAEVAPTLTAGTTAAELQIPLELPPRSVTHITRLEGTLAVLLPGSMETFRFQQLDARPQQQLRRAAVTVTMARPRKNNRLWEIQLRVRYDQAFGALASHRGWIFRNECYLLDASDQRIEHVGFETTRQSNVEVGLAYLFDLPGTTQGLALVYQTPGTIVSLPVTYELKDIPLP